MDNNERQGASLTLTSISPAYNKYLLCKLGLGRYLMQRGLYTYK